MDYWLKALGTAAKPMRDDWLNEGQREKDFVTSRRRMSMRPGDRIALYATGHGCVYGAGTVRSFAYEHGQPGHEDFDWRVDIALDPNYREFLHDGVPLDHANVDGRDLRSSVKQKSQIRLSSAEFEALSKALRS